MSRPVGVAARGGVSTRRRGRAGRSRLEPPSAPGRRLITAGRRDRSDRRRLCVGAREDAAARREARARRRWCSARDMRRRPQPTVSSGVRPQACDPPGSPTAAERSSGPPKARTGLEIDQEGTQRVSCKAVRVRRSGHSAHPATRPTARPFRAIAPCACRGLLCGRRRLMYAPPTCLIARAARELGARSRLESRPG